MVELGSLDSSRKVTPIHEKVSQINFVWYSMRAFVFLRKILPNTFWDSRTHLPRNESCVHEVLYKVNLQNLSMDRCNFRDESNENN